MIKEEIGMVGQTEEIKVITIMAEIGGGVVTRTIVGEEKMIIGGTIGGVVEAGNIAGVEAETVIMIVEMAGVGGEEMIADHAPLVVVNHQIPILGLGLGLGRTRNHLVGVGPPLVHILHVLEAEVIQEIAVVAIVIIMISMITTKGSRRSRIGGK